MDRRGEYLSMHETTAKLGVSPSTLSRLARRGELLVYQRPVDRRERLIHVADLERLGRLQPLVPAASPTASDANPEMVG
jgi:hypothetical protein